MALLVLLDGVELADVYASIDAFKLKCPKLRGQRYLTSAKDCRRFGYLASVPYCFLALTGWLCYSMEKGIAGVQIRRKRRVFIFKYLFVS